MNTRTISLFFSLLTFFLISCQKTTEVQSAKENTKSIIQGHLVDLEAYPATHFVRLEGYRSLNSVQYPEYLVNEAGNFRIELNLEKPEVFLLKPFNFFYLYVFPGDSIHINTAIASPSISSFSGRSMVDQAKLNAYFNEGYFTNSISDLPNTNETIPEQAQEMLALNNSLVTKFVRNYEPGPHLKRFLTSEIKTRIYESLFKFGTFSGRPVMVNSIGNGTNDVSNYYSFIEDFKKDIPHIRINPGFQRLVNEYFIYSTRTYPLRSLDRQSINNLIQLSVEEENDELRSHLLQQIGNYLLENEEVELYLLNQPIFEKEIVVEDLWKQLEHKYEQLQNPSLNQYDLNWHPLEIIESLDNPYVQNILSRDKNLIWMTFWTAGCSGSRMDINQSQEFIKKNNSNSEIDFIYFSREDEFNQRFLAENKPKGEFYDLAQDEWFEANRNMQINHFPFHILIDKRKGFIKMDYCRGLNEKSVQHLIHSILEEGNNNAN